MGMTQEAAEARRIYQREYRRRNRERVNEQRREWRACNPDKVRRYNEKYWKKVSEGKTIPRVSWSDYGIDKERLQELREIARSDEYAGLVLSCAIRADKKVAGHIVLSVTEDLSYENIEFHKGLGRCTVGRTNFYGLRRLFFHYLDCALKETQMENVTLVPAQGQM